LLSYFAQRVLLALVTMVVISMLSFIIIHLPPGDYVDAYIAQLASSGAIVSAEEAANLRIQYGLDQPIYIQYLRWIGLISQGNFGMAMEYNRPVMEVIGDRLPLTLVVSFAALVFTWLLALPIGIYSAVRQYSVFDYVFTFVGFIGLAIPNFLLALTVLYLGFQFFNANIGGLFSPEYLDAAWSWAKVQDLLSHLAIPAVVLGVGATAQGIRIMRANLLDEKRKPYVVAARARGVPESKVILKYPTRVALNPMASQIPFILPQLVGGSIIVSVVLSLPTVGPLLLKALIALDMFLAGTIILLISVLTVVGSLISDLLLVWIDPRIRMERR
jgi:peptide/nickel transport system permease protein